MFNLQRINDDKLWKNVRFITGVISWENNHDHCDVLRKEDDDGNIVICFVYYERGKIYNKVRYTIPRGTVKIIPNMTVTELTDVAISIAKNPKEFKIE